MLWNPPMDHWRWQIQDWILNVRIDIYSLSNSQSGRGNNDMVDDPCWGKMSRFTQVGAVSLKKPRGVRLSRIVTKFIDGLMPHGMPTNE